MAKTSHSQDILSEIERFLSAGRYEDAKILLNFVDNDATDRETRLYLLLINVTIDGPLGYQDEIDEAANLLNPSDIEKEIARKILLQASQPREEHRRSPSREDAEHRRQDESGPPAFKQRVAEIAASKDPDPQSWQVTVDQPAQPPQTRETTLDDQEMRYRETIRYLEIRLSEKDEIIESRDAEFQATESKVDQLTAQLAELAEAKDQEVGLLREELAYQSELLQVKDDAIKNREEQFAKQFHALENQLGEKQSLLQNREAELESLTVRLRELTQECVDLKSERGKSERLAVEELRESAELLQTSATAIEELEKQTSTTIASFERQLAEKQQIVEQRSAELAELRGQMVFLTERLAAAEAVRRRRNTAS